MYIMQAYILFDTIAKTAAATVKQRKQKCTERLPYYYFLFQNFFLSLTWFYVILHATLPLSLLVQLLDGSATGKLKMMTMMLAVSFSLYETLSNAEIH